MRVLVAKRITAVPVDEPKDRGDKETKAEAKTDPKEAEEQGVPAVIKCPDCGCKIDTQTGKAADTDAADGSGDSLDESDSKYPTAGPFGAANDAARGAVAEAKMLGSLKRD